MKKPRHYVDESQSEVVDTYLFNQQFDRFLRFVRRKSGIEFTTFSDNSYTDAQEGYKYEIRIQARAELNLTNWKKSTIGSGRIIRNVLKAIEFSGNNLVPWQNRFGAERQPQKVLYEALKDRPLRTQCESALFGLFRTADDSGSFNKLCDIFGRKYPLLAYLFFLKD